MIILSFIYLFLSIFDIYHRALKTALLYDRHLSSSPCERIVLTSNPPLPLAGDVLAGAWQYMCQPWSCFREIAFDIIFDGEVWAYIGYGRFQRSGPGPEPPPPEPSSSSSSSFLGRDGNLVLDEIE